MRHPSLQQCKLTHVAGIVIAASSPSVRIVGISTVHGNTVSDPRLPFQLLIPQRCPVPQMFEIHAILYQCWDCWMSQDVVSVGKNVLRVLEACGAGDRGIPVFAGASEPLVCEPRPASSAPYYGVDGLGDAPEVGQRSHSKSLFDLAFEL